jgi:hypothetical protein
MTIIRGSVKTMFVLAGTEDLGVISSTKPRRRFHKCVENGRQVEGRAADDLELGGRGLLLQRLTQVIRALAQLIEQACILDSDNGLSSEVLDQLDLLVGERPYLLAINRDRAHKFIVLKHWNAEHGSGNKRQFDLTARASDQQKKSYVIL